MVPLPEGSYIAFDYAFGAGDGGPQVLGIVLYRYSDHSLVKVKEFGTASEEEKDVIANLINTRTILRFAGIVNHLFNVPIFL